MIGFTEKEIRALVGKHLIAEIYDPGRRIFTMHSGEIFPNTDGTDISEGWHFLSDNFTKPEGHFGQGGANYSIELEFISSLKEYPGNNTGWRSLDDFESDN